MHYGGARRNSREARQIYQQRYPLRYIPSHRTFQKVDSVGSEKQDGLSRHGS